MRQLALVLLTVCVAAVGVRWGTFAVGGSDSYCYVHQAERWASGRLQVAEPLVLEAPWPAAALTFAPAGHLPSPTVPGAIVPICPPGLSIVVAPFLALLGVSGVFLVVPLFGALLIVATYRLGARFERRIGLAAALLTACSPVFLFQVIQPMSDVPAAALWVLAVAAATGTTQRSPLWAGLATSAAILMRPNLLPLGVTIGVWLAFRPERTWTSRARAAALYAAACAPGCLAVALIQWTYYGSPLHSGYGSLDVLFALEHVVPNAQRYVGWLWQTHSPLWLAALAAPVLLPGWLSSLVLTLALVNLACYLPYVVFNDWWYLRFLLPAIPLLLVLMVATIDAGVRRALGRRDAADRVRRRLATAAIAVVTLLLAVSFVREARVRQVFDLARLESRYVSAGRYVARRLPANALVVTSWESGSVRFYSGRRTLVWDGLDPAWLDRALAYAGQRGLEPYFLFERWEEPVFRQRFAASAVAALDWPPMAEVASQVRIYRPGDRARYFAGNAPPTEYSR